MKKDKVFTEKELAEINALFQEAADKDMEDVVKYPLPIDVADIVNKFDDEGWDEFVERVLAEGLPEEEV